MKNKRCSAKTIRVYHKLEEQHQELKAEVQQRIEQAARGEIAPLDIDDIKAELTAELNENGDPK